MKVNQWPKQLKVSAIYQNCSPLLKNHKRQLFWILFNVYGGSWVAQSVERPTSAQVMTSQFVGSSPISGSVLTAQSLEPDSVSISPSLSLCPSPSHTLSISLSKK